jgi:hypothetical protein
VESASSPLSPPDGYPTDILDRAMIGVPVENTLATGCERRIGQQIRAASTIHVRRVTSPEGRLKTRKREAMVIALAESDVWFLEYRYWIVGFSVGAVLCRWPRHELIVHWRRWWWAWPSVWRLELSWPGRAFYIEADLIAGPDADATIGLTACDAFERAVISAAPSPG